MSIRDKAFGVGLAATAIVWSGAVYGPLPDWASKVGLLVVPQVMWWAAKRKPLSTPLEKKLMMVGFGLSTIGDACLSLLQAGLMPGIGAFMGAQVINTAAFCQRAPFAARKAPFVTYLSLAAGYVWFMWPHLGSPILKVGIALYAASIALMAAQATAAAMWAGKGTKARRYWQRAAIGGALQFLSDAILGYNLFVAPLPAAAALVLLPYWASQALYAASLAPQSK